MAKKAKGPTVSPSGPDPLPQPVTKGMPPKPRVCFECGQHRAVSLPGTRFMGGVAFFCDSLCASSYAVSAVLHLAPGYCEEHDQWTSKKQPCVACAFKTRYGNECPPVKRAAKSADVEGVNRG